MMDAHSFVVAGFVSEATFALTLALLAWSDRRTRGTRWLAAACLLQLAAMAAHAVLPAPSDLSENAGSCLLVLVFFFVYLGLRWFVVRRRLTSMNGPVAVSAAMGIVLALGFQSERIALAAAHAAAVIVLGFTVVMLLRPRITALRGPAQASAALLVAVMAVLTLRVMLGLHLLNGDYPSLVALGHEATVVSVTALGFSFVGMFVAESKRRLHDESRLDALTGLRNRRAFEEIALIEVQRADRESSPLTMLMIDLDHFKKLNDTWGHALGDRALRAFAGVLLTVTDSIDTVGRLGGEEFGVLLPGRAARSAMAVAERLRVTVENLHLSEGEERVHFTISVGLSSLRRGELTLDAMLHRADRALYQAKRDGRNRVVLADSLTQPMPPSRVVPELHPIALVANTGTQGWRKFGREYPQA
jgi:diguanylate cyclase (GGDEF)-like protein